MKCLRDTVLIVLIVDIVHTARAVVVDMEATAVMKAIRVMSRERHMELTVTWQLMEVTATMRIMHLTAVKAIIIMQMHLPVCIQILRLLHRMNQSVWQMYPEY